MKLKYILPACVLTVVLGIAVTAFADDDKDDDGGKQAKLAAQAKVSKADAQATALAKVPNGTVKDGEIEKEDGKLIWSFDITTPDSTNTTEVNVDAVSGSVVSVQQESAADEAKEAAEEKGKKDKDDKD